MINLEKKWIGKVPVPPFYKDLPLHHTSIPYFKIFRFLPSEGGNQNLLPPPALQKMGRVGPNYDTILCYNIIYIYI